MKENKHKSRIPIYQVDVFTDKLFKGNPACVCLLKQSYDNSILQSIAAEMNLSETAFALEEKLNTFSLRWFTPEIEVALCGHATLATAAILFYEIGVSANEIIFRTKSGKLTAKKDKNGVVLNFPIDDPVKIDPPQELLDSIGITNFKNIVYAKKTRKLLIHLPDEKDVRNLRPNFELMRSITTKEEIRGVIVTSLGYPPYDFISRYFAPWVGINEDPVTGSAHTVLTPYWSKILGKREMLAYQASSRGGRLIVRLDSNNRVGLTGNAVIVFKGELYL